VRIMPRWVAWAIGAVVVACAAGLILVLALGHAGDSGQPAHPDTAALSDYTAALASPTKEGGRIVQQEMKPSLGEFEQGQLSAADFVVRARGWQLELARVRDLIDHLSVPPGIAAAGPLFHQAMQAYIDAAKLFEQAGEAPAADRPAALQHAVDAARKADGEFDQASAVVQRALRNAGLQPDHNLPDPSPTSLAS
jgi:hypothetical protein